jgi:hypothetical protein
MDSKSEEPCGQNHPTEEVQEQRNDKSSYVVGKGVVRKALTSESFVEKLALLLVTVVLSGIIVPLRLSKR